MTMAYCIQISEPLNEEKLAEVDSIIFTTFSEIHSIYNNWNPASEISKLNSLPAHEKVLLSNELACFLKKVDLLVAFTEGRFDPTVEPLQQIWKKFLKIHKLPSQEKLNELNPTVGWDKVHMENGLFWKDHSLTALDLGGIAKGYAVDLLHQRLESRGYKNLYVEWGGEIRTSGTHPNGRLWKIGMQTERVKELDNEAVATSGSAYQNWMVEGISYTHIIDPQTKLPLQNSPITAATVIAPTCMEADGIATALMLFPSKAEAETWAEQRGIQAFLTGSLN